MDDEKKKRKGKEMAQLAVAVGHMPMAVRDFRDGRGLRWVIILHKSGFPRYDFWLFPLITLNSEIVFI